MPLHSPPPPPVCVVRFDSRKRISRRTVGVAGHIRRSELVKNSYNNNNNHFSPGGRDCGCGGLGGSTLSFSR